MSNMQQMLRASVCLCYLPRPSPQSCLHMFRIDLLHQWVCKLMECFLHKVPYGTARLTLHAYNFLFQAYQEIPHNICRELKIMPLFSLQFQLSSMYTRKLQGTLGSSTKPPASASLLEHSQSSTVPPMQVKHQINSSEIAGDIYLPDDD